MSQFRQMSFSMVALLASTVALSACSKPSSAVKTGGGGAEKSAAPALPPQVAKDVAAAAQCPTILGTFTNAAGEEVVYSMASVEGGVSYTRNGQTTVADGKSHATAGNVAESYVAICGLEELKIVTTKADSTTSTRIVKIENVGDSGDVNLHIEVDGVGSTTPLHKVAEASKAEVAPVTDTTAPPATDSAAADDEA